MKVLALLVRLHWGFSVTLPYVSGSRPSYPLPPPSTLVGALAAACGRGAEVVEEGGVPVSSAYSVAKRVRWASAGFLDYYTTSSQLIRYFTGPYQSRKTLTQDIPASLNVAELFSPISLGYVFSPGGRLLVTFWGEGVEQYKDCAWWVYRVGSKESIVAVEDVEVAEAKAADAATSLVYFPTRAGASGGYGFNIQLWRRGGRPSWLCTYMHHFAEGCESVEEELRYAPPGGVVEVSKSAYVAEVFEHYVVAAPRGDEWHYE
ncbi:MAG: type I-A CRISPR-associated protein Cas5a [Pyrobaculum sp.]|jgi:CRISPR-associated protein Cas5a/b/c